MDSERRYTTVIYADISGFTALSEKLDPEEVTDVMNGCFESLENIVITHGGVVNKYLGDCVMAIFGLTDVPEVAARKAVEASLAIRAAIYQYNQDRQLPSPLDIHVGVNGGPVLAGMIGGEVRREYTVTGDAVTFAARLEDASERGQIFVGPDTYRDTNSIFDYKAVDSIALRENEPPLGVYELLGARDTRKRIKRNSERRRATVLFADVYGFKTLGERMSPEQLTALLNRCLTMMASIVDSYGGVVDKYIGECIMALFGVPNAIENAPQQAVNAAIEMRNRLERFNRDEHIDPPLDVHIGINTGLVIAGEIGGKVKRDFTVMGDTVNLASRLKDASHMGSILVGPETYKTTVDTFEYQAIPPLTLKGKSEPVPAYEVTSEKGQVHRAENRSTNRMIFSDLVGRDRELQLLREAMEGVTTGRGGIVSLIGEAGLGKSRLLSEALQHQELGAATILIGRATSIGQNLSFHPFIDLLRQWAGISDEDLEAGAQEKLERAIRTVVGDQADDTFPFVATLMGLHVTGMHAERIRGIDPDSMERLMVKSTRDLFEALSRKKPLILIFEDLHWADQSSIKLLESILRLVEERSVLFLNVFRPDYAETAERIMGSAIENFAQRYSEIRIEPLDPTQSALLVQNLLRIDDMPPATRKLITERAEGNPFYIEEVVRSFIDAGAVEYVDGTFRVTEKIESVVIPGTVQEVIMARVDRLDEATRHLLQVASVIGRNFYHRIIAEILRRQGQLDVELDGELNVLKEKQLLLERKARWIMPVGDLSVVEELEYIFKHALAQQTVYESLLHKTRKEFHLTVAESIEMLFADRLNDFFGMLAYHYDNAEHLVKAEDYMFKAGEMAVRAAASTEALSFFRKAGRLYTQIHGDGGDPARKALLEKNIGQALLNTGQLTSSIEHFDQALIYMGDHGPRGDIASAAKLVVDVTLLLVRVYMNRFSGPAQPTDAQEFEIRYNRARAQTTSDPKRFVFDSFAGLRRLTRSDPTLVEEACSMYTGAATVFAWSGISFTIARKLLSVATRLVRPGNVKDEFDSRAWAFIIHELEGDWSEERVVPDDLVDAALEVGQFWNLNTYFGIRCEQLIYKGDFAGAEKVIGRITELAEGYGFEFARSNQFAMPAFLHLVRREYDKALVAIDRYYNDRHEPLLHLLALGTKAKIQLLAGSADATVTLEQARALARKLGQEAPGFHRSMFVIADLLRDVLELEQAIGSGDRRAVRAIARRGRGNASRGVRLAQMVARERVESYRLSGTFWWLLGKKGRALRRWEQGIAEGERLGARPELARTYLESARRLMQAEDSKTKIHELNADELYERARGLFAEIGLVDEFQAGEIATEGLEAAPRSASRR